MKMSTRTVSIPTKFKTINGESILGTGDIPVASTGVSVESIYITLVPDEDISINLSEYRYLNLTVDTFSSSTNLTIETGAQSASFPLGEPLKIELFKRGSSALARWHLFVHYNKINPQMLNSKTATLYTDTRYLNSILFNFNGQDLVSSDYIILFGYGIK